MNKWTHSICCDCWDKIEFDPYTTRKADRSHVGPEDVCCFCGQRHHSGIYIRQDPNGPVCKGEHD